MLFLCIEFYIQQDRRSKLSCNILSLSSIYMILKFPNLKKKKVFLS